MTARALARASTAPVPPSWVCCCTARPHAPPMVRLPVVPPRPGPSWVSSPIGRAGADLRGTARSAPLELGRPLLGERAWALLRVRGAEDGRPHGGVRWPALVLVPPLALAHRAQD